MPQITIGNQKEDGFETTYLRGQLKIKANNARSAEQASHFWDVAEKSGYIGEFLGATKPLFSLRPLLWNGDTMPHDWAAKLLSWGFNAIITEIPIESDQVQVFSRLNSTFYESVLTSELDQTLTTGDRLLKEIKEQEKDDQLLFCLPKWLDPDWLWSICEDVSPKTILVFDAENEDIWSSFRSQVHPTKTYLMPRFNDANKVNILKKSLRQSLLGAIVPLNQWPEPGSEAEKALWVAGQSQWWGISSELLAETWQKKNQLSYTLH